MNKSAYPLRALIPLVFRGRTVVRMGESASPLRFRPSENPRLLAGIARFEPEIRKIWSKLLLPRDTVFDVGANIDLTIQRFCSLLGSVRRTYSLTDRLQIGLNAGLSGEPKISNFNGRSACKQSVASACQTRMDHRQELFQLRWGHLNLAPEK